MTESMLHWARLEEEFTTVMNTEVLRRIIHMSYGQYSWDFSQAKWTWILN